MTTVWAFFVTRHGEVTEFDLFASKSAANAAFDEWFPKWAQENDVDTDGMSREDLMICAAEDGYDTHLESGMI